MYQLKKEGRKDSTLASISRKLRYLNRHCDLNQPEKVKEYIARLQCSDGHKDNLVDIYSHYCDFYHIQWTKPKYQREERVTRVPKEEDISARWFVPKMAKNGQNSAFTFEKKTGPTRKIRKTLKPKMDIRLL